MRASALLCEAVQGNVCLCLFSKINGISSIFCKNVNNLHIIHICIFLARIDDGDETDDWEVKDYRTGQILPLRADRWLQKIPLQIP